MMRKKLFLVTLMILAVVALVFSGCAAPAPTPSPTPTPTTTPTQTPKPTPTPTPSATTPSTGQPVVWKAVTFVPKNFFQPVKNLIPLTEKVKTRSNGQFVIQYLGGPEVMPPTGLAEAVRKNVVQLGMIPVEYYEGLVGLGTMMPLSEITPDDERASGAYDYINELHKKAGLFYLERGTSLWPPGQFNIITNKWIDRPQQLAGQKIGASSPIITPFLQKIGAASTIIQIPEFYTALERGVVDGVSDPMQNHVSNQLYEVAKYVVDPPFYTGGVVYIVNLDSWNKLPPNYQTLLTDAAREQLREYVVEIGKDMERVRKLVADKGMKFTSFSEADKEWFLKTMYDAGWEDNAKRYPEVAAKLRPLFAKR